MLELSREQRVKRFIDVRRRAMAYKAKQIANWFIRRAVIDVNNCGGEYITHLKLQKLLYFAQGCYGVIEKEPLFNEKIYAWAHGPVVADLYPFYKQYHDNGITEYEDVNIDEHTSSILEEVYQVFGQYSAWALRNITHQQSPWLETKQDAEIPNAKIFDYFAKNIVEE